MQHVFRGSSAFVSQLKAVTKSLFALSLAATGLCLPAAAQSGGAFNVTNIISDGSVPALVTDPHFINPWGISIGQDFWINTQATGLDYVALTSGTIPFTVTIPAVSGGTTATGSPTGTVFSSTAAGSFVLPNGSKAIFLFSSLDGTLSGWNVGLGTTSASVAQIVVNNSAANASYTDMALVTNATGTFILAANFGQGTSIDVFDSNFKPAKLAGTFTDPNLPANYAPYSVHAIGSQVFVTYTVRTTSGAADPAPPTTPPTTPTTPPPTTPPPTSPPTSSPYAVSAPHAISYQQVVGAGNGIVDVFDTNGNFVARAVTGGNLNSPWGVAIAPATFGIYGNDLLVGNFGDGIINVYDPKTFSFLGQIVDGTGKAIAFPGLWEIVFGTPSYGDVNSLYFAAGLNNETHGLFGSISNTATSNGAATFGLSSSTPTTTVTNGSSTTATISVAPTNNFSGTVTLACSGLPTGATCSFSPSTLTVSPMASATSTVTIQTAKSATLAYPRIFGGGHTAAITSALLLPFASILAFVRRRSSGKTSHLRLFSLMAVLFLVSTGIVAGCSSSNTPMAAAPITPPPMTPTAPTTPTTPTGSSQVTITATAGAITQNTVIALNVQ